MCNLLATITLVYFACSAESAHFYESPYWMLRNQEHVPEQPELNLTNTYFLNLRNYQVNAKSTSEVDHPWIARVIHSQVHFKPQLCTAICISKQIFISGARCVDILKLSHTSLLYKDNRLNPKAFVLPKNETKQMYDDIGFIIVRDEYPGTWESVELLEEERTDKSFKWFGNMKFDDFEHEVIGYATFKPDESDMNIWKRPYYLTKLDVHVSLSLCHDILLPFQKLEGFNVPCYHSCTLSQFEGKPKGTHPNCINYHGSQGSALINKKTKKLLGVATWGAYYNAYELPVGFATPNSDNFFEDRACAEKIRNDDNEFVVDPGYYQDLCDGKRMRRYFNRNPRLRKGLTSY